MVIDTSALVAILLREQEADDLIASLVQDPRRLISSFSYLECAVVLEARKGPAGVRELGLLMHEARIEQVALDADQAAVAINAYRRYGKGRHPAKLNIGDCCSYALASISAEPLLFKGDDFTKTDLPRVDW